MVCVLNSILKPPDIQVNYYINYYYVHYQLCLAQMVYDFQCFVSLEMFFDRTHVSVIYPRKGPMCCVDVRLHINKHFELAP